MAQRLKRLLAMQETWIRFLGQEDPLEKEMATHYSILAWRIPWAEQPGRLQSMRSQRVRVGRSKDFVNFMLQSPSAVILEPPQIKSALK